MSMQLHLAATRLGLLILNTPEFTEVTGAFTVDVAAHRLDALDDKPVQPSDVAVLAWCANGEVGQQPLEFILARLRHHYHPWSVVVVEESGTLSPPRAAVTAAAKMGMGLLWASTSSAQEVTERLRLALASPSSRGHDQTALIAILTEETGVQAFAARIAEQFVAAISIRKAESSPAVVEVGDTLGNNKVFAMDLWHSGSAVGSVSLYRDHPLDAGEQQTLRALQGVLAMALRIHGAEHLQAAPAQEQLTMILGDDLQAREAALRRSRRLRLFPPRRMQLAVIEPFDQPVGRGGLTRLAAQLDPPLRLADPRATQIVHEGAVVILFNAQVDVDLLLRGFRRASSLPLSLGLSRVFSDVRLAAGSHRQARRAATIGRRLGAANQITRYEELGLLRLLYQLPEHERREYASETLGPVAGADSEAGDYRRTLRALSSTQYNLTEAARELFIHRNTLRLRLQRLESVLGPFIDDPQKRLAITVALELHRLDEDSADR